MIVLGLLAASASADTLPELGLPEDVRLVDSRQAGDVERSYPLGAPRRIGGQLRMEGQVTATGDFTALTYRLAEGHEGLEAFTRARQQLLAQGATLLFWCQGRDCGSSSLWANAIFGKSMLYGPENRQAFLLATLPGSSERLLALYGITRGNGRAYLHVEQLMPGQLPPGLLPTPATLLRQLRDAGMLSLPQLQGAPDEAWVTLLARALQKDSTLRVSLVGAQAEAWHQALRAAGVRSWRLEAEATVEPGLTLQLLP